MLRFLATGLLTRNVSRRLARAIPNPIVRTAAIAAAGLAVNRLVNGRAGAGRPGTGRTLPGYKFGRLPG
jgi:hypothetical protein